MPTYDYVCRACGHRFEHFQSMQEAPLRKCPECRKLRLERLIGAGAGILFKGSGFYETDYKRKSPSSGAPKTDGGPSTDGSKGESAPKPEASKPDAGAEPAGPSPARNAAPPSKDA